MARTQALAQEKAVKAGGFSTVKALEGEWHLSWNEVVTVSIASRPRIVLEITTTSGNVHKLFLLGKESALGFADRADTARAVRDEVTRHSPRKLAG